MNKKLKFKIGVDIIMIIILPILMAYSLVGEMLHEWIGVTMFTMLILHHILNFKWHKNFLKGTYSHIRLVGTLINIILFILMIFQMISGIILSKYVFIFLNFNSGMLWARTIHMAVAYWAFVLMSVHAGMHLNVIIGATRKIINVSNRNSKINKPLGVLAVVISIYGMYAFIHRQIGSYMFLKNQFVLFDFNEPLFFFFVDYISIMWLFICIGNYFSKAIIKYTKKLQ